MGNMKGCGVCCSMLSILGVIMMSVIGNLIRSEYEYLMVNTLRGEHAIHAADACQSAAIMYVATLVASCVCICSDRGGGGKQSIPGKE